MRQILDKQEVDEKFHWKKTGVAEMLRRMSRAIGTFQTPKTGGWASAPLERELTPEQKGYDEIKGGIITGSVGVALMIFLYVFMQGIIIGGKVRNDTAEILSRIWVAGVIPVFEGLARV